LRRRHVALRYHGSECRADAPVDVR
jgi:hypothetical protein